MSSQGTVPRGVWIYQGSDTDSKWHGHAMNLNSSDVFTSKLHGTYWVVFIVFVALDYFPCCYIRKKVIQLEIKPFVQDFIVRDSAL